MTDYTNRFNEVYTELQKAIKEKNKLQYFKNELIKIIENKEQENNLISKSYGVGKLSTYADGSVWRKVSSNPSKWKMVRGPKNYNTETHGAKIAAGKLKKEIQSCKSYAELLSIVVANKNRFVDDDGRYLPIVKELMDEVNKTHSKMKKNKINNISLDEKNYLQDFKDLENTFGTNYKDYKGKETEAIYKLMSEKKGFVRGAYYRNDLGDLDLVWGKITNPIKHTGMGLIHIFDKHKEITPEDITRIVNNGKLIKTYNGYKLVYENYILGINHGWKRNGKLIAKNDWIVTSFEKKEDKKTTTIAHADNFTSETISSQNLSKNVISSQNNSVNKKFNSIEDVKKAYYGTDKWMKAPNGKPTKLNENQWCQVRTENFKNWFGDWENDPENASKIIDENGEPLVVYHGTLKKFSSFKYKKESLNNMYGGTGFHFTTDKNDAESYITDKEYSWGKNGDVLTKLQSGKYTLETSAVLGCFLCQKKIISYQRVFENHKLVESHTNTKFRLEDIKKATARYLGITKEELEQKLEDYFYKQWPNYKEDKNVEYGDINLLCNWFYRSDDKKIKLDSRQICNELGFDGIKLEQAEKTVYAGHRDYKDLTHFVVFNSNQIKSATDNNGSFNPNDNSINKSFTEQIQEILRTIA